LRPSTPSLHFWPFQRAVFSDRSSGLVILHWSRQIGKSFTLAAWAVDRLLSQLQRHRTWLITVLSNSRENGAEFVLKAAQLCTQFGLAQGRPHSDADGQFVEEDLSADVKYENMRMEIRVLYNFGGETRLGRIKVLAANPRTARGFSGDLILDEFAFHEDSAAIWEAAEPILSARSEYLCRIASTGNGKHNMFYRMVTCGQFNVSRVSRTEAYRAGVQIYDPVTRLPITPAAARQKALDKRAYDQNYELAFNDENMALLTQELISSAERVTTPVDEQAWSAASLARMAQAEGELYAGHDIGRQRDLSVVTVLERAGRTRRVVGMLRMAGLRLPAQQAQLEPVCQLPRFRGYCGDMTGLGLGLVEYLQEKFGGGLIRGVNFSSTEPLSGRLLREGRTGETARVTELMASDLLAEFEGGAIEIPSDQELRDDLRKPERVTSPGGRVSIAATRDEAGHADHFWSLALAVRASRQGGLGGVTAATVRQIRTGGGGPGMPVFRPRRI
jgi:phage FluMu gp28-like protein